MLMSNANNMPLPSQFRYNIPMVHTMSIIFAILAILSFAFVATTIASALSQRFLKCKCYTKLKARIQPFAYEFAFIVALVATLGSLFYSDIAHFTPCKLCWYQRILMYPQSLLLYIALIRRERFLSPYLKIISAIGFVIASYHTIIQWIPQSPFLPCSKVAECGKIYSATFGFITIPFMSMCAFALIFTILTLSKKDK